MPEIDPVILQLRADVAKYQADMAQTARRVQAGLDAQGESIVRLERRVGQGFSRIGSAARALGGALAGVSGFAVARNLLRLAEEAKSLDAQLRLATDGFGAFAQAQEDVAHIARETRTGLADTTKTYANFVRVSKEAGSTQADAARATETIAKTFKISGASAVEAAQSLRQLTQGLQSGVLRGDEFNSVMEAAPRFARLLAESLNVPIGGLRKMAEEGELTSEKLLKALTEKKFTAGIDAEFKRVPVTVDDAMTQVRNSAVAVFGAFDRGGEFSNALANFFFQGADGFTDLAGDAEQAGIEVRSIFEGLGDAFAPLKDSAADLFDYLIGESTDWGTAFRDEIHRTLQEFDAIRNFSIDIENSATAASNRLKAGLNEAQRRAGAKPGDPQFGATPLQERSDTAGAFLRKFTESEARLRNNALDRQYQKLLGGYDVLGNPIAGTPAAGRGTSTATPAASKKTKTPKSPLDAEAFAREEAQLNQELLRLKADQTVDYRARAEIELARLQAAQTAYAADVNADERFTADQRKKLIVSSAAIAALEELAVIVRREEQAARDALDIRLAGLRDEEDVLRAQSRTATTREERRNIELRLLDIAHDQERADLEAVIASKEATEAQKQIARARLGILDAVKGAEQEAIRRETESPIERRRREVRETAANMDDAIENLELDAIDRLTAGLADASTEFIKLGGIAGDVLNRLINDFIRLQLEQAIFGDGLGGGGGLFGNIIGGIGSIFGGARATGGPVQAGTPYLVGEKGEEIFVPQQSGTIIPNNMLQASAAPSGGAVNGTAVVRLELSGDLDARIASVSEGVSVEVVRAAAPSIANAGANEAIRRSTRRTM